MILEESKVGFLKLLDEWVGFVCVCHECVGDNLGQIIAHHTHVRNIRIVCGPFPSEEGAVYLEEFEQMIMDWNKIRAISKRCGEWIRLTRRGPSSCPSKAFSIRKDAIIMFCSRQDGGSALDVAHETESISVRESEETIACMIGLNAADWPELFGRKTNSLTGEGESDVQEA